MTGINKSFFLSACLLFTNILFISIANAQSNPDDATYKPLKTYQLEELAEPIALYPDNILKAMLPASTFPDQIVDAALQIKSVDDAKKIQRSDWDPSVKVIATYPGVLQMMYSKLQWTTALGEAYLNQNQDLLNTVQRLRAKAKDLGNLKSNSNQTVKTETTSDGDTVIVVQSANPDVVYVPQTTSVVYEEPVASASSALVPLASFGLGMALGAAIQDNHEENNYYYGPGYWGGGYDYWHNRNENYDKWMDYRRERWEDHNDRAWNRQEFRQEMAEEGKWNPADAQKNREQYQQRRQQWEKNNPDKAAQYQARKNQMSQTASERGWSGRQVDSSERAAMQDRTAAARSDYSRGAFQDFSSRRDVSSMSNRGASSRAQASQMRSFGGGRSFSGGGGGGRRR